MSASTVFIQTETAGFIPGAMSALYTKTGGRLLERICKIGPKSEVEHAVRDQFAAFDRADGNHLPGIGGVNRFALGRSIAAAQDDRLPAAQTERRIAAHRHFDQFPQTSFDIPERRRHRERISL